MGVHQRLESFMVCVNMAIDIMPKMLYGPHHGKCFNFSDSIILTWFRSTRRIGNWSSRAIGPRPFLSLAITPCQGQGMPTLEFLSDVDSTVPKLASMTNGASFWVN